MFETERSVQAAVLAQPIHECREVVLGYDAHDFCYIHFPQFCGLDFRVYKQVTFHPNGSRVMSDNSKNIKNAAVEVA